MKGFGFLGVLTVQNRATIAVNELNTGIHKTLIRPNWSKFALLGLVLIVDH